MSRPSPDFLYFAYGSNMSSRRLTAPGRAPSATRVTVGYVPGRRLTFDKFSTRDRSGKCDCEATGDPAELVYGVVYRIAALERAALDAAEGLHKGYRGEILTVIAEDATHRALVYVATDKRPGLTVFDWYLEHVLRGATENGLPPDYVESLRRLPTVVDGDRGRAAKERAMYAVADPTLIRIHGR
jgi:gamma-glutamylcyclotransferase